METITIAGKQFMVPVRYPEGYTLAENEAAALQKLWRETIRNNLAQRFKKDIAAGRDADELQAEVDEYCETFKFGMRASQAGPPRDPVTLRAMVNAKDLLLEYYLASGKKLKDLDRRKLQKDARQLVAETPALMELAKQQLEQMHALKPKRLQALAARL